MREDESVTTSAMPDKALQKAGETCTSEPAHMEPANRDEIAALAYEYWVQRGCPIGSPEEDWFRAENELGNRKAFSTAAG